MAKTCSVDGCNRNCWKNGLCLWHTPKLPIKKKNTPLKKGKGIKKISEKGKIKKEERKAWLEELHNWEFSLWDKKVEESCVYKTGLLCIECGDFLSTDTYKHNLCCYSHLISKSSRKDLAMIEENLAIVCPDCHSKFEANPDKTPKQKELRDKMREKYGK